MQRRTMWEKTKYFLWKPGRKSCPSSNILGWISVALPCLNFRVVGRSSRNDAGSRLQGDTVQHRKIQYSIISIISRFQRSFGLAQAHRHRHHRRKKHEKRVSVGGGTHEEQERNIQSLPLPPWDRLRCMCFREVQYPVSSPRRMNVGFNCAVGIKSSTPQSLPKRWSSTVVDPESARVVQAVRATWCWVT